MDKQQVRDALRDQRKAVLQDQKEREKEILALYEEQESEAAADRAGALWGETQFSALPGADDMRSTDLEAKLLPDYRDPETVAMMHELWGLVLTTVREVFGEKAYDLFLEWLFGATVAELVEERDEPFTALLRQIKAMVSACRSAVGEDLADVFPFKERADPRQAKRLNDRRAYARMIRGETVPADESARVYLTPEERAMPFDSLREVLKSRGYKVARTAAYRAKLRGWFYPKYVPQLGAVRVELTPEERKASRAFLCARFGICMPTATDARRRGWFAVNVNNRDRVRIPEDRTVPPEALLLVSGPQVELTPEERAMSTRDVADRFHVSMHVARRAKKRGWFLVVETGKRANIGRLTIPADRAAPPTNLANTEPAEK